MLYKYPDEFIVPIIYVKDLKYGPTDSKVKVLFGGLLDIPEDDEEEEYHSWKLGNKDKIVEKHFPKSHMNYFDEEEEEMEDHIHHMGGHKFLEDHDEEDYTKDIFTEIDNEYVNNEIE